MEEKSTKVCKHCKEQINKGAKRCPKCGGNLGMLLGVKVLIVIIIIFFCLVCCVNGCSNAVSDAVDETKNSYNDINGKTSFKLNETFENKYEKITMTEVNTNFTSYNQYLQPATGNKYIMAKFEVENINSENDELYVSSYSFNASADGVVAKSAYLLDDNYQDFSATVGYGKKTSGYVFYEVPITAQKIEIEYNADFWTDGNAIKFIVQE